MLGVPGAYENQPRGEKACVMHSGDYAYLPSHHQHRGMCRGPEPCIGYLYSDAAADVHWIDEHGNEISVTDALKAVILAIVKANAKSCGLATIAPHDLRRTCARLCHQAGGEVEQIQFLLGHVSIQTTEQHLGCQQRFRDAVNDHIGLEPHASSTGSRRGSANHPDVARASRSGRNHPLPPSL